jgi:hypothetical protein
MASKIKDDMYFNMASFLWTINVGIGTWRQTADDGFRITATVDDPRTLVDPAIQLRTSTIARLTAPDHRARGSAYMAAPLSSAVLLFPSSFRSILLFGLEARPFFRPGPNVLTSAGAQGRSMTGAIAPARRACH